jgi:hypothetical protein
MLRKVVFLCIILMSLWQNLFGSVNLNVRNDADHASIPFYTVGRTILLGAVIDDRQGFVVLDTGAPMLILNKKHFSGGRDLSAGQQALGINGQVEDVTSTNATLRLGNLTWKNAYAKLYDLEHLEESKDATILGLLGGNLFRNFELVFDFKEQQIHFFRLNGKGARLDPGPYQPAPDLVLPYKLKGHIPYIEARVGKISLRMGIDSGAGVALVRRNKQSQLRPFLEVGKMIRVKGVRGETTRVAAVMLNDLTIGELAYRPLRIVLTDLEHLNDLLGGTDLDGILGFDFLGQYKTAINFKKREIRIWVPLNPAYQMVASD